MVTPGRRTDRALVDLLFSSGPEFDFFQAVNLLSRLYPHLRHIGEGSAPAQEFVRFRAHSSTAFPASAINSIDRGSKGPTEMTVAFMGLTGPQGVLPSHYSELIIEKDYEGDRAFADFLDIFNHRLISIFYRAWEKHRFHVSLAREALQTKGADRFTGYLFSLIGMGTSYLTGRLRVPDQSLLRYAGLLAQRPHSASALRGILADHFELPVEVDQFRGKWYRLENNSLSWLDTSGVHNQLGSGAIAGDAIWNQQSLFRVRVGPVGLARFIDFLPDGKSFEELVGLTRYFTGDSLEAEFQVVLAASEVPSCRLTDETADAPRLGWMGWLKTEDFLEDATEAVFAAA